MRRTTPNDPGEVALEKAQRAWDATPAEERQPELEAFLRCMKGLQAAEQELVAAQAVLGEVPDIRQPGAMPGRFMQKTHECAELYQGLAHLLDGALAGLQLGCCVVSPGLQDVLHGSVLYPFFFSMAGRLSGGKPRGGMVGGVQLMQCMAAAWFLTATGAPSAALLNPLHMLESGVEEVWPGITAPPGKESADARQAKRLLASRHWVPSLGSAGGAADAGSSSDGADASAEDPTQQAREIEAALEQHGCGVSLADVRLWALLLWLELGGIACLEGNPQAPSERRLLVGCQLALSSGQLSEFEAARVLHIAAKAATGNELQASAAASQRGAQLVQLLEEGMQRADAARVYKEASALARNLLPLLLLRAQAQGGSERAATFSRADQLSAQLDAWRQLYKRWLPSASTRQLAFVDGQVQASARDLKRQLRTGRLEGLSISEAPDAAQPKCSHCGTAALSLAKCSACRSCAYCSRACQLAHWKSGGHKQACAQLAARRAQRTD